MAFEMMLKTLKMKRPVALTLQDVAALQLLHGRPLAQSPAEKHQDYVLDHRSSPALVKFFPPSKTLSSLFKTANANDASACAEMRASSSPTARAPVQNPENSAVTTFKTPHRGKKSGRASKLTRQRQMRGKKRTRPVKS